MALTLSVLRCPDQVAPETREVGGGEFNIGRGSDNDWVLADPDRHLSKRHCVVAFRSGTWQLADVSTNGTFLNREA
ncbi:MAG: FHA domain-containing protein, partial [Acetobacteraceae bacterium]